MTRLVAVDVGGTNARFALAEVAGGRVETLGEPVTLQTAEHNSFARAWARYREIAGGEVPSHVAIAIAGPVRGEELRLTNNSWIFRPATLAADLGVDRCLLVNDFEAVAHAVAQAGPEHFLHLGGPDTPLPEDGTISVLGPGTGLGVASLWRRDGIYHVQATEGGHIDFAPLDATEDAILARLRRRYRRVSVERIVSGPAIIDLCEALAALEGEAIPPRDDRTLWQLGLSREDELASTAVDRFCMSLGSVAGDMALAQGAVAVVIAGGVGQRLRDRLPLSGFAGRFRAKGRFEAMMASLPVKLITHPQPGLFGAAAAFAREGA